VHTAVCRVGDEPVVLAQPHEKPSIVASTVELCPVQPKPVRKDVAVADVADEHVILMAVPPMLRHALVVNVRALDGAPAAGHVTPAKPELMTMDDAGGE
jgi:hypothetical protein